MKKFITNIIEKIKNFFRKLKNKKKENKEKAEKVDLFEDAKANIAALNALLEPEMEYDEDKEELTEVKPAYTDEFKTKVAEKYMAELNKQYPNVREEGNKRKENEIGYVEKLYEERKINTDEYNEAMEDIKLRYMTKEEALKEYPMPKAEGRNK